MKKNENYITIIIIALLVTVIGISYAWFTHQMGLSTLMTITPPDSIDIVPVDSDGHDATILDMEFQEGDLKTEDGQITIRRPIYVYSSSPAHQLEIVHTTNLNSLNVSIYAATKNENGSFSYDIQKPLTGYYVNREDNSSLAKKENLLNYKVGEGDVVEEHAYPLYWIAGNSGDCQYVADTDECLIKNQVASTKRNEYDPVKQVYKNYYTTYYILEINWQENSKETDLFYIMAQNIAVIEQADGGAQ